MKKKSKVNKKMVLMNYFQCKTKKQKIQWRKNMAKAYNQNWFDILENGK